MIKKFTLAGIIFFSFICNYQLLNGQLKSALNINADTLLEASDFSAKVYGFAPYKLTNKSGKILSYTSSNTAVATIADSTVTIVGAGTSDIIATVVATPTIKDTMKLTVHKKNLDISTPNVWRYDSTANPKFVLIYSGFVNGEDENDLTTKPVVTTKASYYSIPGVYNLTIGGGYSDNYSLLFNQTSKLTIAGVALTEEDVNVGLYPNPAIDLVTINGITSTVKVVICNSIGNVVKSLLVENGLFSVSDLPAGLYLVKITDGEDTLVRKLIVE